MPNYDMTREAWMANQQRFQEAGEGRWQWPLLDLAGYDRRGALNEEEQAVLGDFAQRIEQGRSHGAYKLVLAATQAPTPLTRIAAPLCDVLDVSGAAKSRRRMTMRVLLLEVYRRRTVYWDWKRADWLEILGDDAEVFWRQHHVARECRQQVVAASYLLGDCTDFRLHQIDHVVLARTIFGKAGVELAVSRVEEGYKVADAPAFAQMPRLLCQLLLTNHSPRLSDLSYEVLRAVYAQELLRNWKRELVRISTLLAEADIVDRVLPFGTHREWMRWCQRWYERSTIEDRTRRGYYIHLMRVGRWLAQNYPDIRSPVQWTPALTQAFVQEVDKLVVGQWAIKRQSAQGGEGSPDGIQVTTATKINALQMLRTFFRDCRQWGWLQVEFDPGPLPWSRDEAAEGLRQQAQQG